MLLELCEYLLTPCPALARRAGLKREAVAIRARHARNRLAWRPHLEASKAFMLECARRCPRQDLAVVLGSGALLDVPLHELAGMFKRVILADVVHPLSARWQARTLPGVSLAHLDASGALEDALAGREPGDRAGRALPDYLDSLRPDFIVSANILSQIPLAPLALLHGAAAQGLGARLVREHLRALEGAPAPVCLITDTLRLGGEKPLDLLHGVPLPGTPERTWTWNIAPRPEISPDRDYSHQVAGLFLPN
ncbi:hypothetical protein [Fundidesulfovibrio agrisoli]|uniref:hypothetical protein n=1 Tax=Fundidesulfovibrio agrisoli TaxID=2922717 RepID=UPI001FAC2538|nr:hypothetical protein [Fundidesulfovibrio agrisoli]